MKHCVNLKVNHKFIYLYVSNCCPLPENFGTKLKATYHFSVWPNRVKYWVNIPFLRSNRTSNVDRT